jgi:hypothetical protein
MIKKVLKNPAKKERNFYQWFKASTHPSSGNVSTPVKIVSGQIDYVILMN